MERIFSWATAFNQPVNKWNINKYAKMDFMFYLANNFNQSIDEWKLTDIQIISVSRRYHIFK